MSKTVEIILNVNGRNHTARIEPRLLLVDFLRHDLQLTGTHVGCEHGVCGACTVMMDGRTARSCLHFAIAVQGSEIRTVESLAEGAEMHPIQEAFHQNHGLQCGYCTPGMLMTAVELLERKPDPDTGDIRQALADNLCRCTGYVNIIKSVSDAAARMRQSGGAPAGEQSGTASAGK